jgi:hypothetical protein
MNDWFMQLFNLTERIFRCYLSSNESKVLCRLLPFCSFVCNLGSANKRVFGFSRCPCRRFVQKADEEAWVFWKWSHWQTLLKKVNEYLPVLPTLFEQFRRNSAEKISIRCSWVWVCVCVFVWLCVRTRARACVSLLKISVVKAIIFLRTHI